MKDRDNNLKQIEEENLGAPPLPMLELEKIKIDCLKNTNKFSIKENCFNLSFIESVRRSNLTVTNNK